MGLAARLSRRPHYLWDLRPYFRQCWLRLVLGSVAGIAMNTAIVLPPIMLGRAIDAVRAVERGDAQMGAVGVAVAMLILGTLATEGPRVLKRWWLQSGNARIRAGIRADALRGVLEWPMGQLHSTPTGDLLSRIIGDVEVLGVGVREFTVEAWDTVLFSISLVTALFVYDARLSALALPAVPAALVLAHYTRRAVAGRTTEAREASASLTAALEEHLLGVRVLRLFGRAPAAVARVKALSHRVSETKVAQSRLEALLGPLYQALIGVGVVIVIWRGGARVVDGAMTLGAFVAYLELYLRFVNRGFRLPQLVNSIQRGGAAYERIGPLLMGGTGRTPVVSRPDSPGVRLADVVMRYPGATANALDGVSLDVPTGTLLAVTGAVGSGKSALARVLVGLYGVERGDVSAGSVGATGYLPQEPLLFSGTIAENVALQFTSPPDPERVARAVGVAALDLADFPDRLATQIGERGVRVSGGQRQRIGLARAVAATDHPPRLLVLDDPFSAVDVETEVRIVRALRETFGPAAPVAARATIVLCSHRLAAFPLADQVVVLEKGRVAERGPHAALLEADGLYARIYRAQSVTAAGSVGGASDMSGALSAPPRGSGGP